MVNSANPKAEGAAAESELMSTEPITLQELIEQTFDAMDALGPAPPEKPSGNESNGKIDLEKGVRVACHTLDAADSLLGLKCSGQKSWAAMTHRSRRIAPQMG